MDGDDEPTADVQRFRRPADEPRQLADVGGLGGSGQEVADESAGLRETLINRRAWDLMGRPGLSGWMVDQWVLSRVNDVLAR